MKLIHTVCFVIVLIIGFVNYAWNRPRYIYVPHNCVIDSLHDFGFSKCWIGNYHTGTQCYIFDPKYAWGVLRNPPPSA